MKINVCAIIKDEARYLAEWLAFHIVQGVKHFILYDNDSTDNTRDVLKPFIKKGLVTLIAFPGEKRQLAAYSHYAKNFGRTADWTAFIDADEFLYSRTFDLPTVLKQFSDETVSVLAVHWYFYGSSKQDMYEDRPVTLRFIKRAATPDEHVKSLVKTKHFFSTGNDPHTFKTAGRAVDENFVTLPAEYARSANPTAELIRINHYHTKSKEEARVRWMLKRADNGVLRDFDTCFNAFDLNEVYDDSAALYRHEVCLVLKDLGIPC